MAEYSIVADGSYAPPPGGVFNEGEPIFSMIQITAVEADPGVLDMGPVGDYVRMAPGREGLISVEYSGEGYFLVDAEATEHLLVPDTCNRLGFQVLEAKVENSFGSRRIAFFLQIQDNFGVCP